MNFYDLKANKPNGQEVAMSDFKGKVVLFSTIQESCPSSCAVSFWHLNQIIYQHLRKNQKKLIIIKMTSLWIIPRQN